MLKSSKLVKILILFILVGCLIPSVSAKNAGEVIASGRGKISWVKANGMIKSYALKARIIGDVEYNAEGGVNFPVDCVLQMIAGSTKQGEILKIPTWFIPEVEDEVIVGFTCEINGQFIKVKSIIDKNGKTHWVTQDATLNVKGQEIELNIIWKLNIVLEDYQINNVPEK